MLCRNINNMFRRRFALFFCVLIIMIFVSFTTFVYKGIAAGNTVQFPEDTELSPGIEHYLRSLSENDTTEAEYLKNDNSIRILCLILTVNDTLHTRARVVNATWLKRCNKHFFVLKTDSVSYDIINTPFEEKRNNIVRKVQYALGYLYDNHIDEFDWVLKADDDTYVIVENLRKLLESEHSTTPSYLGFHFDKFVSNGYMSGGAGYVISQRALRRFVEFGMQPGLCPIIPQVDDPENSEDIEIGRCLNVSGVSVINSLDEKGRETFHPYPIERHAFGWIPEFVYDWAKNQQSTGPDCCGKYSISFHYVNPQSMLLLDHLLYRTAVYGISTDTRGDNTNQTNITLSA